jgi:hypothetical protein
MKLVGYELRKMLAGYFWKVAFILLIIINAVLFIEPWNQQNIQDLNTHARLNREYRPFYDFLSSASKEEIDEYFYEAGFSLDVDIWHDDLPANLDEAGHFLKTRGDEYNAFIMYAMFYQSAYPRILTERENIVEIARHFGGLAYMDGDKYNIRLNLDIIRRYSTQPTLLPAFITDEGDSLAFLVYSQSGWSRFMGFMWGDIFTLLLTLLISARAFPLENETKYILRSTVHGHRSTVAAKLVSVCLIGIVFSLLFSTLNFLMATWMYGTSGASASVLSLTPILSLGPLTYSIGKTAWFFVLYKAFGALCYALVCAAISYVLRGMLSSYIGGFIFLGGSLGWHYFTISNSSIPFSLRLLPDVTLWSRPIWMFESYRVKNIFNYPILWSWVCFVFWLTVITILFLFVIWSSEKRKEKRSI